MISLIVGLGNIGECYQGTRHNIGFDVVDLVAQKLNARTQPPREYYEWAVAESDFGRLVLAKPTTVVNRSGDAVRPLRDDAEVELHHMLVIVDDFNLPLGVIRLRAGGSDGGHRGLASLIEVLGTEDFPRLRLGIGPVADNMDAVDFVLDEFASDEQDNVRGMIVKAAKAAIYASNHRLEETMTRYNSSPALPDED